MVALTRQVEKVGEAMEAGDRSSARVNELCDLVEAQVAVAATLRRLGDGESMS